MFSLSTRLGLLSAIPRTLFSSSHREKHNNNNNNNNNNKSSNNNQNYSNNKNSNNNKKNSSHNQNSSNKKNSSNNQSPYKQKKVVLHYEETETLDYLQTTSSPAVCGCWRREADAELWLPRLD